MPTDPNRKRQITRVRIVAAVITIVVSVVILAVALRWWVEAEQETSAPGAGSPLPGVVIPGLRRPTAAIDLPVAGISGTIRDLEGAPIGGARVCAWRLGSAWPAGDRAPPQCSEAGPDGFYVLQGLPPLRHAIHASAPRHQPARIEPDLSLRPGENRGKIDLALAPGGVAITGVVQDLAGGVVEGAWVANGDGRGPATASARSDSAGRFTLWVSPGPAQLAAQAEGYADGSEHGAAPGEGIIILLTPESVLVGSVVTADTRAPVAGARVTVIGDLTEAGAIGMGIAYTDAAGQFRLAGLQPGVYKPRVQAEGRDGEAERSVHLGLGETSDPLTIVLHPVTTLAGRIAVAGGSDGCPRGEVYLTARMRAFTLVETTDETGAISFPALRPDTYDVRVQCPGYVVPTVYPAITVGSEPVTGVVWEIRTGRAIRGTVVDARGRPVSGVGVSAWTQPTEPGLPEAGADEAVDAAGRFAVEGLVPGTYRVQVFGESVRSLPEPITVDLTPARDVDDVQIRLPEYGQVRGIVVDDRGDPVPRCQVIVETGAEASQSTLTARDGTFLLGGVAPGEVRLFAAQPGPTATPPTGDPTDRTTVSVVADAVAEVRLVVASARGEIRGRVLHADGGPVTDAFVTTVPELPGIDTRSELRWGGSGRPVLTDADGNFTLDRLGEGLHALRAYRRGGGEATVEHVATGTTTTMTITPTAEIGGSLSGELPEEFGIYIVDERTMVQRSEEFYKTEGRWGFEALPAGSYDLYIEATTGTAKHTVTLQPDDSRTDIRVTLTPPGRIRGQLVDAATGAPIAGMRVQANPITSRTRFSTPAQAPISDDDGRFEIPLIVAGTVQLSALGDDPTRPGMSGDLQVEVGSGQTVEVVLPVTSSQPAPPVEANP